MNKCPGPALAGGGSQHRRLVAAAGGLGLALLLAACGSGSRERRVAEPFLAVLAAFPAELAALLDRAAIEETVVVEGRRFRLGTLGGVRVVLGMTGIGLVNAADTTRAVLARFAVSGVVVSGVAGAPQRIADVTVPAAWELNDGSRYTADPAWLALAEQVAASQPELDRCTVVPATGEPVCLPFAPALVIGGVGRSDDPFLGRAFPCQASGDDVFGCDVPSSDAARTAPLDQGPLAGPHEYEPAAVDMETAAIARVAAQAGLPYIAFRAVSDGAEDPLNLPGFPAQFFAYYRLAASNAAEATLRFLVLLAERGPLSARS